MVETVKEKVIITGAKGLLGSALCEVLTDKFMVVALSHNDCDITDNKKIKSILEKEKPKFVINPAALTEVDLCEKNPELAKRVNVVGARNIAQGCAKIKATLVQISTDYIFDGEKNGAYTETDIPRPLSVYAQSKLDGENAVKDSLDNYYILRVSWLFGRKGKDFVDTIINRIKSQKDLVIVDDKLSIPTYNYDLSKAILDLIFKLPEYGIYNIANSGGCSWFGFAKEIARCYVGKDIEIKPKKMSEMNFLAKRPKNTVLDCNKFKQAIGYNLRPWQEALREYVCKCYKS